MSPSYDFQCTECEMKENIWCHHSMKGLFTCSKCGGKLKEIVTAPAFIMRGFRSSNGYE